MNDRPEFTKATRLAAFQRADGNCEGCGGRLLFGDLQYDHILSCTMGGTNELNNCAVLCSKCHRIKTSTEAPRIAKSNRQRNAAAGIRKCGSFATNRGGAFKKKISGEVVPR